jgi:hypothetical protein
VHKAQLIINEINTRLNVLIPAGVVLEVMKNRTDVPDELPAVAVRMGPDEPENQNATFIDSSLIIYTDIYVITTAQDLDEKTLAIRLEVHKKLMVDYNLGLGFVTQITPLGQSEPDYNGEGEQYAGATRLSWRVSYRSNVVDPSI